MKINILKNTNRVTSLFWVILFLVFWFQVTPQTHSILESTLFSLLAVIAMSVPTTYLSNTLLCRVMRDKKVKVFVWWFLLFSVIEGLIFGACLFLFREFERAGYFPQSEYFEMEDIWLFSFAVLFSAGMIINICMCGLRFLLEYLKSQKTILEYQLRTLQHQVTPHFMFNVLNHIHVLMQTDVELASSLLIKYSEILRYQLYNGDKESVTVEEDIQFLKDFIAVEELRWGENLTVSCSWNIEDQKKEIPSLLFITFIENAFKYVSRSAFERGYIRINFEQKGDTVCLEVENSKSVIAQPKNNASGLGLKNIRERLDILYYGKHTLSITETDTVYRTQLVVNI